MTQERNKTGSGRGDAPLTARSVLASTLLGSEPPELPVAYLVHVAGLFGINPNRARVALSRMVQAGEATTDGAGLYRLAGHLLERRERQHSSRAGRSRPWDGYWSVVIVTAGASSPEVRLARRRTLSLARLAELRDGVWIRPANLDLALPQEVRDDVAAFRGHFEDIGGAIGPSRPWHDERSLARSLFGSQEWADRARELLRQLAARVPGGPGDLAEGFVLSASVLRHLQADPLLPAALLGDGWPGERLREAYDDWDRRYRAILRTWSQAGSLDLVR